MGRQGLPTATQLSGIERFTILPAPITLFRPIFTGQNNCSSADPNTVLNRDRFRICAKPVRSFFLPIFYDSFFWFGHVRCGIKLNIRCDQNIISYYYFRIVDKSTIDIDYHIISYIHCPLSRIVSIF